MSKINNEKILFINTWLNDEVVNEKSTTQEIRKQYKKAYKVAKENTKLKNKEYIKNNSKYFGKETKP